MTWSAKCRARTSAQLANDRILYAEPVELPAGHYVIDTAVTDEQVGKTTVRRLSVFVDPGQRSGLELGAAGAGSLALGRTAESGKPVRE